MTELKKTKSEKKDCVMKKKRAFYIILLCGCILTLSGCNSIYKALSNGTEKVLEVASDTVGDAPKNAALDVMDTINEIGGNSILTSEKSLQGERITGIDNYVGTYSAEYNNFSKTEYLFGGTDIERESGNDLSVTCTLQIDNGTAKVFWTSGSKEAVILIETDGTYNETITLPSGGNYIGIECEDFTGYLV